jgi:hypothetical protein
MVRGTIELLGRKITITAGRDTARTISGVIRGPLRVCSMMHNCSSDGTAIYTSQVMFGSAWSWDEFPAELKAQYDKDLAEYAAQIPDEVNVRTKLPSHEWVKKYIPMETKLNEIREARKSPEKREEEAREREQQRQDMEKAAADREAAKQAREAEQVELIAKYPFLSRDRSVSSVNLASSNIRILLGRLWPAVRFSVRLEKFSMGDSITVAWTDGPTEEQVKGWCNRFESGHFDGMDDMYNYEDRAWHTFGQTKYMHCRRDVSEGFNPENEMPESDVHAESFNNLVAETTQMSGVEIRRNMAKNGLEIVFSAKPAEDVLNWLKSHGYRWSRFSKVWYKHYSESIEYEAREYLKVA